MINKNRLIKLMQQLIRIDSQNPGVGEAQITDFVKKYLSGFGIKSKIYEFAKGRANIIAQMGNPRLKSLLITPHLDTVPAGLGWKYPAFSAKIVAGKMHGVGSTDCKVNLACSLEAMHSLVEAKAVLGYNLIFAATADEESGSGLGLIPLLDKGILKPDAAVVLDADDFEVIVAQKGLIHLKVKIKGKRAHGAYPWLGVNAINQAVKILSSLESVNPLTRKNQYHASPTINIGTIKGGDKVNIVADWCEFELDLRFLPGSDHKEILKNLERQIRKTTKKYEVEIDGIQQPYQIKNNHPLVKSFLRALKEEGIPGRVGGSEGATTISFFQAKGIPAIATGFGCLNQAHSIDEYVTIDNLYKGAKVLELFLKKYNGE